MENLEKVITLQDLSNNRQAVYDRLDSLGISYEVQEHAAFYTCQDVEDSGLTFEGLHIKNLFVRDSRSGQYYLVLLPWDQRLDVKGYRDLVGWSRRIAFCGDQELATYMGVAPGSCSVFGLLNDQDHVVTLIVGRTIATASPDTRINFHPNDNRATVTLTIEGMRTFIDSLGCTVIYDEA